MSAYLITSLLLKGWKREGEIRFGRFYYRRALRLFPANYVMIGAFLAAAWFLLDDFDGHVKQALAAGLYVSNWTRAFEVPMPQFLGHTWSLAIEEQVIPAWPLLPARRGELVGFEMGHAFALYAADLLPQTAEGLGLRFEDKDISKENRYVYRIFNIPSKKGYITDTAYVVVNPSNFDVVPSAGNRFEI